MAWLPIVGRELRVASRRKTTYWSRAGLVFGGCAIWLMLLAMGSHRWTPGELGQTLFVSVGILAFAFCLVAGVFLTADCLSHERREGTIGLLFLTDLKGYDIVCGKLAATSLAAFFGLLSLFPILSLPILIGGVTVRELLRVGLALVITLVWSLSLGVMVSAICREARNAISLTLLLVVVIAGGLPFFYQLASGPGRAEFTWVNWLSPGWLLSCAFDNTGRQFWSSLVSISATAAGALLFAVLRLPYVWLETGEPRSARSRASLWGWYRHGSGRSRARRKRLLDESPFRWAAGRNRVPERFAWIVTGTGFVIWLVLITEAMLARERHGEEFWVMGWLVAFAMHQALKWMVAIEASLRFNEMRRSGALELLLGTPLSVPDMLIGQQRALLGVYWLPLAAGTAVSISQLVIGATFVRGEQMVILFLMGAGSALLLGTDYLALVWTGMWVGLIKKSQIQAVAATFFRVLVPPWLALLFLFFVGTVGFLGGGDVALVLLIFWYLGCLVLDLALSGWARGNLEQHFRAIAAGDSWRSPRQPIVFPSPPNMGAPPSLPSGVPTRGQ